MTGRVGRGALGVGLAACWVAAIVAFGLSQGAFQPVHDRPSAHRHGERSAGHRARHGSRRPTLGERARETVDRPAEAVWRGVRVPAEIVILSGAGLLTCRGFQRRRRLRSLRRFEIRLGREDVASPYKREKLFDGWHGQLSVRWWTRLACGQPWLGLELHQAPDRAQKLALVCPCGSEAALEGRLLETYPDVRLVPMPGRPSWTDHVIRLKKRRSFIDRLQTVKDDEQALCESLLSTMARLGEPATVQLLVTPGPWLLHRWARSLLKRREHELTRHERQDRDDIGVDSVVEDKELKGALETQHRSLYFAEIRIASRSRAATRALAGVFSELRSENALAERQMFVRHPLYAARVAQAAQNPFPSFGRGVLSSSELAALWSLPRQRAKGAQLDRSPVRRAPAPPQVCRDPGLALMRDERGPVGLHPGDRRYGLALIGGQGTGKTSAMARTIAIDAQDRDAAVIVLDPKHDLADHTLGLVPEERTVWYMDLARPEVGIDPLGVEASPGVVADMLVAALREANPDGAILAASDRFLRHAAMAVCAVEERPTLWHMLELLSPRREEYRDRVIDRLGHSPEHAALLRYWGTSFPELWQDATRGQLGMALDAPRNKLERLITTVEVDKALRHPFAIDLRRVIRERQVLIVNGSLGEVGQDNAVTVMQLVIQLLHQALKQQQRLPPEQRPRVCLKVDEAHLVLTPSFAELLALHRAAGLEVVAAWQYNAQLQDPVVRSGLRSLLRSVSMFAMGEVRDARDQAEVAMEVYTDSIKSEREDLERLRISPDDVVRLPVHAAVSSWVARGARRSAFVAGTFAMEDTNGDHGHGHLARQRKAGAAWPELLPAPAEVAPDTERADPDEAAGSDATGGGADGSRPAPADGVDKERDGIAATTPGEPPSDSRSREDDHHPSSPGEERLPASYRAVHRDRMIGLAWDEREREPRIARSLRPTGRDLEILRALWRCRMLLTSQIAAEWWSEKDLSAAQRRLARMASAGWVERFRPTLAHGTHEWVYRLAADGFRVAQRHTGPDGPYIDPATKFVDRRPSDRHSIVHDLQVNAWVLAYRHLAGDLVRDWWGPDHGALEVPTKPDGRRFRRIELADVPLEGYLQVRGLGRREFARVLPDATLALVLSSGRRVDLLVELDRTRRPSRADSKFLRYDALLTAWWRCVARYRELGEPPAAVFVFPDEELARSVMKLADEQLTGCIANPGESPDRWRYPGRERTLFVAEADVHQGRARAWKVPAGPPSMRAATAKAPREVRLPVPP